jgi:hypothetical protein
MKWGQVGKVEIYIEIYEYFDTESEMKQNKWHYSLTRHDTTIARR